MKMETETAFTVGGLSLLAVILLVAAAGAFMAFRVRNQRKHQELIDARKDAKRWYDMLGKQLNSLSAGDDAVASRALNDATGRHSTAAGQLGNAATIADFHEVRQTATEGLHYIGAARARLGLVAGPQGPPPVAPDGRPMYEEVYRVSPPAAEGRRREKTRETAPVRGVARVARHQ